MAASWSRAEVEATVADHRAMLALELSDQPFNKREHNRNLQKLLNDRSAGSVERKHQNISAVLIELGYPWIDGYKPLGNYQELLLEVVKAQVEGDSILLAFIRKDAEQPGLAAIPPSADDILAALENPPAGTPRVPYLDRVKERSVTPPRLNYLELEASNAKQGQAGEEWVLAFEQARLRKVGRNALAEKIEWVSRDVGDHVGFDIRSFEENGKDRFVEVKTTKRGKESPFFVTRNEVRVSRDHGKAFHLYRLFRFSRGPRLYTVAGALDRSCVLDPTEYEARVG